MGFWFAMLGLLLGGLFGNAWTGVMGGVIGYGYGRYRAAKGSSGQADAPGRKIADKDLPRPQARQAAVEKGPELLQRVQLLEEQVTRLQSTVNRLSSQLAALGLPANSGAMPEPAPAPQAEDFAPTQPPQVEPEPRLESVEPALIEPAQPAETAPSTVSAALAIHEPAAEAPSALPPSETPAVKADWPTAREIPSVHRPPKRSRSEPTSRPARDLLPAPLQALIFGGNTIVKVGVLILFLGLSFLLKYVAQQVTVPVEMRYASVALMGAGLLALGWRLRNRRDAAGGGGYGLILQGAGVGVFYLTTLAAMKLHPLLPASVGFAMMVLVTAFTVVLALVQDAPWLAIVASASGFLTPVLVSTGSGNHIALFSYLAILDFGIVAVAWFRAWRPLNLVGFLGTFGLASAWAAQHYTPAFYDSTQGFLLLFFLLFTAVGVLFARRALALGPDELPNASMSERAAHALRQVGRVDSTLVFGVPLAAYSLQYLMVRDDPWLPALSALVMGGFYSLLGTALWRSKEARYALLAEAYVVVGVLFGTLSVPLALEGVWTGATWAVEAASMYWLGTRQHRTYSRAFALALMAAAGARMLGSLSWSDAPDAPWLVGSVLGTAMLAASGLLVGVVHRRAALSASKVAHTSWEGAGVNVVWCLAMGSLVAIPWMSLMPLWASVTTSLLALGSLWLADRYRLGALQVCAPVVHVLALTGFASTLHRGEGDAMLANGMAGLTAAVLMGLSMLGSAWLGLRNTWAGAQAKRMEASLPPHWPLGSSLAMVAGLGLISLGLLFLMPLAHANLVWPLISLAVLWAGLKLAHPALAFVWAALNAASAVAFMAFGPRVWPALDHAAALPVTAAPLGGLAFWTPLVLMVTAVVSAAWLQQSARRPHVWRMPWVATPGLHVLMLGVSLWWWAQTLPPELLRLLESRGALALTSGVLSLWVTLTSVLMLTLAVRLDWPLIGQAAALTVSAWVAVLAIGPAAHGGAPLADLGWLAWSVALVWHLFALRRGARWWAEVTTAGVHVAGFWLFGFIATRQTQWFMDLAVPHGSAWQAVGWVAVPLVLVALLSARRWHGRWPLSAFPVAYRFVAALPLVITVLGWLLWSLSHAGDAAPLPYVPLLNPLELGQALCLLVIVAWGAALPGQTEIPLASRRVRLAGLGLAGLGWLTTMVLRACHHWGGVPWDVHGLFASRLAQAALSVTWALVGVGLMIAGHRRVTRQVWVVGASLLAVVVAKLFFIELADRGGLYRIVSFIAVGLLLLVVGYFAPVPPSEDEVARRGAKRRGEEAV